MTRTLRIGALLAVLLGLSVAAYGGLRHLSAPRIDLLAMQASQGREAARWPLEAAALAGNARALRARGLSLHAQGHPQRMKHGMELLERAARQGEQDAALDLGRLYFHGAKDRLPDYALARYWLEQATASRPAASYYLALIERNGLNGPANPVRALEQLQRAADGGIAEALFLLGNAYRYGEGVERDDARALACFQQAATLEHAGALQALALAHAHGELGLLPDDSQASVLFSLAHDALQSPPREP